MVGAVDAPLGCVRCRAAVARVLVALRGAGAMCLRRRRAAVGARGRSREQVPGLVRTRLGHLRLDIWAVGCGAAVGVCRAPADVNGRTRECAAATTPAAAMAASTAAVPVRRGADMQASCRLSDAAQRRSAWASSPEGDVAGLELGIERRALAR